MVQSQLLWPGELAQPGTPVALGARPGRQVRADLRAGLGRGPRLRVGTKVEIELDSEPGTRVPGEVSFVADQTNFTPEKIETRSDRVGQVYRAKVRILEGVERFTPGSEGNVYLLDGDARDGRRHPGRRMSAPVAAPRRASACADCASATGRASRSPGSISSSRAPGLVGVVGPDGAGKTTLLRCLVGLLEVEADEASVLGVDLRGDVRALKARIGYVPQVFGLQRELSVAENLAFTARLHRLEAQRLAPARGRAARAHGARRPSPIARRARSPAA